VFAVLDEARNLASISGGVWRPGEFGVGDSTRLWDVIERAGGLVPDAFATRAQIQRLQPDYTRRLIPVSLAMDATGNPVENPVLEGMDQILVFAERELRDERVVRIGGWVREPGTYPFADDMTVADLVLVAGGLRTGAHLVEAEVSRIVISTERADTLTQSFQVGLGEGDPLDDAAAAVNLGRSEAALFSLRDQDAVWIRQSPGFEPQATVVLTGEVHFPGPYSIRNRNERLTDVIARAGGLTGDAYARGFQLWRRRPADVPVDSLSLSQYDSAQLALDSLRLQLRQPPSDSVQRNQPAGRLDAPEEPDRLRVGVAFADAIQDRTSGSNLLLEDGDSIHVPRFIPTVVVRGAVAEPGAVVYREGRDLGYYIRQVGGYVEEADKSRVRIRLANGQVTTRGRRFLVFGGGIEDPDPGSVITVPFEPPSDETGIRITEFVGIVGTLLTAAASIIIAASR
jgi:protein involved in polysaccharide export with SLBB domain